MNDTESGAPIVLEDEYQTTTDPVGCAIAVVCIAFPFSKWDNSWSHAIAFAIFASAYFIVATHKAFLRRKWTFVASIDGRWTLSVRRLSGSIDISGSLKDITAVGIVERDYAEVVEYAVAIDVVGRGKFWLKSFGQKEDCSKVANTLADLFLIQRLGEPSSDRGRNSDELIRLV